MLSSLSENDELLLINDGSEDLTTIDWNQIKKLDPRINLIHRPHLGLVQTLNFGLSVASHELIARADADDLYDTTRIQKQTKFLKDNPEVAAVFSDYRIINNKGKNLGTIPSAVSSQLTKFSLINHQRTPHSSVMFRKSAVVDAGGYSHNAYPAEDMELWIRLARNSNIASLPEILLTYLKNQSGISSSNNSAMKKKTNEFQQILINDIDIECVMNDAEMTLDSYNSFPLSDRRKLLFFRDLFTYQQFQADKGRNQLMRQILKMGIHFKPGLLHAAAELTWERKKRH